jgi:hypothetical protein
MIVKEDCSRTFVIENLGRSRRQERRRRTGDPGRGGRRAGDGASSEVRATAEIHGRTVTYKLVHMAITLDHMRTVPVDLLKQRAQDFDRHAFALWALRDLVFEHLWLFPVDYRLKQAVCQSLQIPIRQVQGLDPRRKVVGNAGQ